MRTYEAAVARGTAWLDRHRHDWREKIKPERLRMQSCLDCILGQIDGTYLKAVMLHGDYWATDNGFCADYDESNLLRDEWLLQLKEVPHA